jgi:uncharacterized membrane protein
MKSDAVLNRRLTIPGMILLQVLGMIIVALFAYELFTDWHDDSIEIYYNYSSNFLNGELPYRDFNMEYPPLALLAFSLPFLLSLGREITLQQYFYLYLTINALLCITQSLIILSLLRRWQSETQRQINALGILLVTVLICAPLIAWRYDLFPALLTLLSLYCLIENRNIISGLSLGIAVSTKLYPVVLVPVFALYLIVDKKIDSLKRFILGGGISIAALVPFFILSPNWLKLFLSYHQQRGLEIESLYSGIILLFQMFGIGTANKIYNFTAFHISSPYATIILKFLPYFTVFVFAMVITSCFFHFKKISKKSGNIPNDSLIVYTTIITITFIALNKVLSPQYVIWVLPFVPLLRFRYASLLLAVFILTNLLFPLGFRLLLDFHPLSIVLLNFRNALLIILVIWMMVDFHPFDRLTKAT